VRGQRRLDRFEALDVIRLGPTEPPLDARALAHFWRNAVHKYRGYGYHSDGVTAGALSYCLHKLHLHKLHPVDP
jgi:hypothetical protein